MIIRKIIRKVISMLMVRCVPAPLFLPDRIGGLLKEKFCHGLAVDELHQGG